MLLRMNVNLTTFSERNIGIIFSHNSYIHGDSPYKALQWRIQDFWIGGASLDGGGAPGQMGTEIKETVDGN